MSDLAFFGKVVLMSVLTQLLTDDLKVLFSVFPKNVYVS